MRKILICEICKEKLNNMCKRIIVGTDSGAKVIENT